MASYKSNHDRLSKTRSSLGKGWSSEDSDDDPFYPVRREVRNSEARQSHALASSCDGEDDCSDGEAAKRREKKRKNENRKLNRTIKRLAHQKEWGRMMKRVQRYLGLRSRSVEPSDSHGARWDSSLAVPSDPEAKVRFIAIDVEHFEMDHSILTEVGIALLDADDIVNVPPGHNAENWYPLIKAHHLRVGEHCGLVNRQFVEGCPDKFNFGQSRVVLERDLHTAIAAVLDVPSPIPDANPIVFVGHELYGDLSQLYFQALFSVWDYPEFVDEADTKLMYQHILRAKRAHSLRAMCEQLGMDQLANFHNAGNDAVYTLRAMLAMAVRKKTGQWEREDGFWGVVCEDELSGEWTDGDGDPGGMGNKSQPPKLKTPAEEAPRAPRQPVW